MLDLSIPTINVLLLCTVYFRKLGAVKALRPYHIYSIVCWVLM